MEGILTAFVRVIIGLVLITILVGALIGIPILQAAAIFVCLAIADTKGGN